MRCSCRLQPPDRRSRKRNITTTQMTRSSILMNNILNWAERVVQWQAARQNATSIPLWCQPDFAREQGLLSDKLPNLRETINQARGARAAAQVPVQSVAPMQLPFMSVRDLDHQCQLHHDQTLAKRHPSLLKAEQRK